jgi:predicted transcriptional regulator
MNTKALRPTESELEILSVLWNKESATVRTVHEEICKTKDAGYTTTLKLMQIMFDKKLVSRDESRKTHVYTPLVSREETQALFVDKMIRNLFAGSTSDLVLQALGNTPTSEAELDKIQALLNTLKQQK